MILMPQSADILSSPELAETTDDNAAMTRGVLIGLGISLPMWAGFAWMATLVATSLLTP